MSHTPTADDFPLRRSSRDASAVRERLTTWLATSLPPGADPAVTLLGGIDANGMSSETVSVDISWTESGARREGQFVARVAPSPDDVPVFPSYRLDHQYRAMQLAATDTDVPVPPVRWMEPNGDVLGTPFFLMERIAGDVPPDVLPYTFGDNWLFDATPEQQQTLQRRSVEILADLHAIPDAESRFDFLDPAAQGFTGETRLARLVAKTRDWYEFGAAELDRSPLVERGLTWLNEHIPDDGDPVLCWGDARIGNVMYRDFAPVAVLDWEMATLGPRELDLGWMVFSHRVFQEIATTLDLPGMPDFLREKDVASTYSDLTGVPVGDLTWAQVHAAVEWACVFLRTSVRQVHFGEIERPDDIESVFHHRPLLERLLDEVGA